MSLAKAPRKASMRDLDAQSPLALLGNFAISRLRHARPYAEGSAQRTGWTFGQLSLGLFGARVDRSCWCPGRDHLTQQSILGISNYTTTNLTMRIARRSSP